MCKQLVVIILIIIILVLYYYINIDKIYTNLLNKHLDTIKLKHCKLNNTKGCFKNFYYLEGDENDNFPLKPSFVLFHGFMGRKELIQFRLLWRELLPFLSKTYNIYILDLPGLGESNILKDNSIENISDFVSEFIRDKQLKRVVVCGRSLGGAVCLYLSIHNPEIDKAIIFSPYCGKGILNTKGMQDCKNKRGIHSYNIGIKSDDDLKYLYMTGYTNVNKYYVKFLTSLYDIKHRNNWHKIYMDATKKPLEKGDIFTDEEIRNIKIPILFIYGTNDEYFYKEYLPNVAKVLLSGKNKENKVVLELEGEDHSSYLKSSHLISKNKIEMYIKTFLN